LGELQVTSIGIDGLLEKLRTGEWLVPEFQRDFVWSTGAVERLVASIFAARPIGMATLWEQSDLSPLTLEHVSLPDSTPTDEPDLIYFSDGQEPPNRRFAILDGRQRSTALAMAFGGLQPANGLRRHAGSFFLSLVAKDEVDRVQYLKRADLKKLGLETTTGALGKGMVPLALEPGRSLMVQWFDYIQRL
jgi:hypothetical protein